MDPMLLQTPCSWLCLGGMAAMLALGRDLALSYYLWRISCALSLGRGLGTEVKGGVPIQTGPNVLPGFPVTNNNRELLYGTRCGRRRQWELE